MRRGVLARRGRLRRQRFGQPGNLAQRRIEGPRLRRRLAVLGAQLVEPREVRQQQPRIEPPPRGDLLSVIEHRLFHPVERPLRQHRLRMPPRQHQRPAPCPVKRPIPPPRKVQPRPRNPHPRRRHPDIAVARQRIEETQFDRGGQDRIGGEGGRWKILPFRGEPKAWPLGHSGTASAAGGRGGPPHNTTSAASPLRHAFGVPPPPRGEDLRTLPRQAHIPLHRNPPSPERTAMLLIHHRLLCKMPNRPSCTFPRCRKMD